MDSSLSSLLRKCDTPDIGEPTHQTIYGPSKKWYISDSDYESFWKQYCKLVHNNPNGKYSLCEINRKHMPIIADFTFKFYQDQREEDEDENCNYKFLLYVVYCYQKALVDALDMGSEYNETCCILKAKDYVEKNMIVSSFRLHFPYCKVLSSIHENIIYPMVIQNLRKENVIGKLKQQPINDWENIIDPITSKKPCIMYGSSPSPKIPTKIFEYMIPHIEKEFIEDDCAPIAEIPKEYMNSHEHVKKGLLDKSIFNKVKDSDYWLPLFFSLDFFGTVTLPKEKKEKESTIVQKDLSKEEIERDDMVEKFLSMLNRERVECTHFWLDVGRALYNCYEGEEKGLELWIKFTRRSDEHSDEECKTLYPTFNGNYLTIKTLAWYAKEDSEYEYNNWHKNWYVSVLAKALSCLHSDVANAIYRIYWLEFASSSLKPHGLYQYKNHVWKRQDNGHILRRYISKNFIDVLEDYRILSCKLKKDEKNEAEKNSIEEIIKQISKLIGKLKTRTFKNHIFSECLELFYIDDLEKKLDENPNLMGMINGVLEAGDKEAVMRTGKPEDFISRSTGLIWRHDLHWKHPLVIRFVDYWSKVFPTKALQDYAGKMFGSCIRGKNSDKLFPIMTGTGNNSKSMVKKLCESAFGAYCITFPTALFTDKRKGSGAAPEIARSKYAHMAFAQEPDADDSLKNGTIKEMTGGDRFFARFLHDNGGEIEPMFTLFLMCNTVPIIPHSDQAMKNRVRLIPYLSTWVKNPPKSIQEQYRKRQFKMDKFFEKQIPELAPAFIWYLVKMYSKYIIEGLDEPDLVTKTTKEYWDENDIYSQFINENIEKAYIESPIMKDGKIIKEGKVDIESKITIAETYSRFRDWFRECFQGIKCPDRPLLKTELEQRMGKTYKRTWRGVRLKITIADI